MTRQEFEQLTLRIRGRLMLMAGRFVKDSGITDAADDIVQESLLMLWSQTENGYEIQNPEALAVTITKKVCLAHLRGSRAVMQSIDWVDVAGGSSASALTDEADMDTVRESLLAMLTPTQRHYLHLRNEMGDPETVRSMTVLKGKAAETVWGEKGKNGVIEIKTKK